MTKKPAAPRAAPAAEPPQTQPQPQPQAAGTKKRGRPKNTTLTRDAILRAAEKVFAQHGYGSARIERIATVAKCNESLIYYYFSGKEALFAAVLESAYGKMLDAEQRLALDAEQPLASLKAIILFPWQYYRAHPELITLLATENLQKAKHLSKPGLAGKFFAPAVAVLEAVIAAGARQGVFRDDVDVANLYLAIMALGYFCVSNRYTLSAFTERNLMAEPEIERWATFITRFVIDAVARPSAGDRRVGA